MINKLKKALDNQESIKSTIIMYGENDFFEEEVFILGDNPLICIPKDELKYLNESKQRFIDSLNHEIKTPITSIIGYSELLLKGNVSE